MNQDIYLSGEKINLRSVTINDYSHDMVRWINDQEVTQFLSRGVFPAKLEDLELEFKSYLNSRTDLVLAITENTSGKYLGIVGLHTINWHCRHAEFRILVGEKDSWGKGIGAEATQLVIAWAFFTLNLEKVWLGVNAENDKAYKSYKSSGFTEEGRLRNEVYRNGKYFDVVRMSMLKSEFLNSFKSWKCYQNIINQIYKS